MGSVGSASASGFSTSAVSVTSATSEGRAVSATIRKLLSAVKTELNVLVASAPAVGAIHRVAP